MRNRFGHRGYIASRPVRGQLWPQHVQNLVVRDYADRNGLQYLLSATEYAMEGCFMNLETVLNESASIKGIIAFSLFMLPGSADGRCHIYDRVFAAGADLHGALEGMAIRETADAARLEDIFMLDRVVATSSHAEAVP